MANIEYKKLSHAIETVRLALNKIIGHINPNTTLTGNRFVRTDSSGNLETPFGFSNTAPSQVAVTPSFGSQNSVASGDHVHPNTCPTPVADNQIANKGYVDNRIVPVGELGVIAGYEHTQILTSNTVHKLTYLNSIVSESITHPLDGSVYVLQRVSEAGRYAVSFYGLYSSDVNNPVIKATVYKGSTDSIAEETHIGSGGKLGLANDLRTGGSHGILTLNAGDYVGVKIISDASTTITHKKMSFSVVKI